MIDLFLKIIPSVVAGTIVYAITKFILDNILRQREIIGDIANNLILYANVYRSSQANDADYTIVSDNFRKLASSLTGSIKIIPFYSYLQNIKIVPYKSVVMDTITNLIGLSNGCLIISRLHSQTDIDNNIIRAGNIKRLLELDLVD